VKLRFVTDKLINHPSVLAIAEDLQAGDSQMSVAGRLRPALVAAVLDLLERPLLIVTAGVGEAEEFVRDLGNYLPREKVLHYRAHEVFPWERTSPEIEAAGARLEALSALGAGVPVAVVAPVSALMRRLPPRAARLVSSLSLQQAGELDLEEAVGTLVEMGYERVQTVEQRGQFALRGGIFDIFPSTGRYPVRLELFGDSIESIRRFLVSSQQSIAPEREVLVFGCRDVRVTDGAVRLAGRKLEKRARVDREVREDLERILDGHVFPGLERYLPWLYEELETVGEYASPETVVVLDEPKRIRDEAVRHLDRVRTAKGKFRAEEYFLAPEELDELLSSRRRLDLFLFAGLSPSASTARSIGSRPVEPALGGVDRIVARLEALRGRSSLVVTCLEDEGHEKRLREILSEHAVPLLPPGASPEPGLIAVEVAPVGQGFVVPDLDVAVVAHGDLFPRRRLRRDHQTPAAEAARILSGLKKGDYVVHELHGIAVYEGISSRQVFGLTRDYLVLAYAGNDRLFVPVEQIGRVSRYVGPDGSAPRITRLSSNDWARATKKARDSVKKLAFDLAKLYAERSTMPGHAFSADTIWQRELEDAFPFEETPDQLSAVAAAKSDMERPRPMDRLVCGDVGYGKTEVAVRAAAKAVLDGKQVMVLAPTTILAQQHFSTFSERFAPFPVRVEVLSRFRTPSEQKRILQDFAKGSIDVLIGTHRLLQKDVSPKDLGLVVVDEEQRFGVGHKEHLKNMRKAIDVLTLTATPIPRTLQMSLAGVRDLSVINTPPEDRFEVQTEVGRYDAARVREAILRELDREGQVFYVFNRVQRIEAVARRVAELVPEARVAVAHGQMHEHELERVMSEFLSGDIDVLVCTTIIESGIDIPTANTLIVEGAERMGLAQLYQLRGRVGRSHHRAFAYFYFSSERILTETALERLRTIREFTELGSGMKIAMRDLEIRGAGNILGAEQHGHMAAVGFELYNEMLRDAIAEVRGEPEREQPEVAITLPIDAFLPATYIREEDLRIEAYRRIADAVDTLEVGQVRGELSDRYGPLPSPAANLLSVAELRAMAGETGLTEIALSDSTLRIGHAPSLRRQAAAVARERGGRAVAGRDRILIPAPPERSPLTLVFEVLNDIMAAVGPTETKGDPK